MSDGLGWRGKKVRNKDGREGKISSGYTGFCFLSLTLSLTDGSEDRVQLNSDDKDSGSTGWEWYCEDFDGGPKWLILGDHNERTEA